MDRTLQNGAEFLSLTTASSVTYHQVTGRDLRFESVADMNEVLHEVAKALAKVAPIYGREKSSGKLKQLDALDLLFGVFQRGAAELLTPYAEYASLCIRRTDMRLGIAVLSAASVAFPPKK